ncbi:MAG: hypothetical protein JNK05_37880 [Myxococcales bacterium]|nr:hypothetical protein [Myxococcales bacterium]
MIATDVQLLTAACLLATVGCGGGATFNGGAAGAFSNPSMTFSRPTTPSVERECLRATAVDGIGDRELRRAVEEALSELCSMLRSSAFEALIERAGPWFSRPDARCVALSGGAFVALLRAAERAAIAVVIDDRHRPAATALLADGSARIELATYQVRRWSSAPRATAPSRGALINTLAHELAHVARDPADQSNPRIRDDSDPNDYVRSWLGAYRFGDFSECFYLARHEQRPGRTMERAIDHCMDVRQNGRNLSPRTRSDYLRDCVDDDGPCARWTRALSWECRAAIRTEALATQRGRSSAGAVGPESLRQ